MALRAGSPPHLTNVSIIAFARACLARAAGKSPRENSSRPVIHRRRKVVGAADGSTRAHGKSGKEHFIAPKKRVIAPPAKLMAFGKIHQVLIGKLHPRKIGNVVYLIDSVYCQKPSDIQCVSKLMSIELPADVLESAGISEGEVRLEIAMAFYKAKRLSLERAAELAGLSVSLFSATLAGPRCGIISGPRQAAEDSRVLTHPQDARLLEESLVVVGIDVGGLDKGFHAVSLSNGRFKPQHFKDAREAYEWILEVKATVVAIDAPCRWAVSGKSRLAERVLAIHGKTIQCFKTPARSSAEGNPFYGWVFNGESLYELVSSSHDLFDGCQQSRKIVLETFPHAVACALAGSVVPAHPKGLIRRRLLIDQGFEVGSLTNIDFVDAALCALTALRFHLGLTTAFGDSKEGFIVVPRVDTQHPELKL